MDDEELELKPLNVFLSYSHKDRDIAGKIKEQLERFGFEVFLAHEDIEPLREWQDEIISKLKNCDILIPIVSMNFRESYWTDQETGFALARSILIIPLRIDLAPYGFIGKLQALKIDDRIPDSCEKIIEIFKKSPLYEPFIDTYIRAFINSEDFYKANEMADLLKDCERFNVKQVNEIIKGYINNSQVRGGFRAGPFVNRIFEEYSEVIDQELKQKYKQILERGY